VIYEVGLCRIAHAEDRSEVALPVEGQRVVDLAVQVHGQLRNAQERPGANEMLGTVVGDEAAGKFQLAVEPGVQQRTTVDLDAGLEPSV